MKPYIIELKLRDTEALSWRKGLSSYLKHNYGSGQVSQLLDDKLVGELDHIRNNANGDLAPEALLEQNFIYYAYLEQLSRRLGSSKAKLKMGFTWYDVEYSFTSNAHKYTQFTLVFEKSSILYNISALLSEVARDSVDRDYNNAIRSLSRAVVCFEYISSNFLNSPSCDIQSENTRYLADLCHAEAQEMYVLKLLNGDNAISQASLISKLAYTASKLFEKGVAFLKTPEEGVVPYGEPKWNRILTCKMHFYRAVSAYYQSLVLEKQNKIGDAIGFLKFAQNALSLALPFNVYLNDYLDFEGFKSTIEKKMEELEKYNDYIYFESVSKSVTFDNIKGMDAVKSPGFLELLEPFMTLVSDKCDILYKGVVSMEVYEKESVYSEEKAGLLRKEREACETAELEYRSFVEFTDLDNVLSELQRRYKNGGVNPDRNSQVENMRETLRHWSKAIQSSKFRDIKAQLDIIHEKRKSIVDILSGLPDNQKDSAVKIKSSLLEASKSDEKLFSLVTPYLNEIELLNNSDALWKKFAELTRDDTDQPTLLDIDDSKNEQIITILNEIQEIKGNLLVLRDERKNTLDELRLRVNDDDVTHMIIANRNKTDAELLEMFHKELEKFSPLCTRIEATVFKQSDLIHAIKTKLDAVFKLSGFVEKAQSSSKAGRERHEFMEKMRVVYNNFASFNNDLIKGLQFYDSLIQMSKDLVTKSKSEDVTKPTGQDSLSVSAAPPPLPYHPREQQQQQEHNNQVQGLTAQIGDLKFSPIQQPQIQPQQQQQHLPASSPAVPPRTYINSFPQPPQYSTTFPTPPTIPSQLMSSFPQPPVLQTPLQPSLQQTANTGPNMGVTPPKPPKELPPTGSSSSFSRQQQAENEERELLNNPTAFYQKPSVFNENLYSKYSDRR